MFRILYRVFVDTNQWQILLVSAKTWTERDSEFKASFGSYYTPVTSSKFDSFKRSPLIFIVIIAQAFPLILKVR